MKILVGYKKGSSVSRSALAQAIEYGKSSGGTLHVLTSMVVTSENQVVEVEAAEKELNDAKGLIEKAGLKADTHLMVRGLSPGEDIVKFAQEEHVDLVVIGIERTSKVGKFVFGSNAQYVILEAPCPVLTVK
jgi:nucleotide-binding universal stress UspA family protein